MLNKFINSQKKEYFEKALNNGEVPNGAIAFIEDTKEIWCNGIYYNCSYVPKPDSGDSGDSGDSELENMNTRLSYSGNLGLDITTQQLDSEGFIPISGGFGTGMIIISSSDNSITSTCGTYYYTTIDDNTMILFGSPICMGRGIIDLETGEAELEIQMFS